MANGANEKSGRRGKAVMAYELEARAIEEKTARLRALRLAREAELAASAPAAPKKAASRAKAPARLSERAATLSDWLATQQREGRRN